ncbi:MAG: pyrroline-5-carboxylate reductase [Alphaproteobacteria bacterium]|nr:pyrroline-5-carboxylate reductase [Alphaproteobacteria bacterium]
MTELLFVGCGKMGSALLRGVAPKVDKIVVVKPTPFAEGANSFPNVSRVPAPEQIDPSFHPDAVILAVKPQDMAAVLPKYARFASSVFLSIAAGKTLHALAGFLQNGETAIVRSMPNLPASIGLGMHVAIANAATTRPQRNLCDEILRASGDVLWIEDEALIDPVTALSGCGPAYVFALVETMAEAGEKLGLPPELAGHLARKTVIGSGALLGQTAESAADLRRAVASRGGSTAAALEHLLGNDGLPSLMLRAMEAAAKRAKELSA